MSVRSSPRQIELPGLQPDYVEAHNNLGSAFKALGRYEDAVASYRKALVIDPGSAAAHSNLGNALKALGRSEDAVASYRKALAIDPGSAAAHNNLGNALTELGQPRDAVASYREALAVRPDFAEAHNNLGSALRKLGRLDDAVASCTRALAVRPDYAEAHGNLANALTDLGRLNKKRVLMVTSLAVAFLLAMQSWLDAAGYVQPWHIILIAGLVSFISGFDWPTRQAIFPALIDRDDMMSAVALNSIVWQSSRMVMPAIGGIVIAVSDTWLVFLLCALGFLAMLLCGL